MFKVSSKTDTVPKGIHTSNRYGGQKSKDLSGSRNTNLRSMNASSTEPNNSGMQSFRNKIVSKKIKIQGNNPTKISPSMSLYASKDKTEEYFSEKIKDIISNDPSLKHSSMNTFCSTSHDKWKPEGYIYYDFLLKHPLMMKSEPLSSKFDQKFPPLNQQILKDRNTTSHIFENAKVQIAPQAFYQPQSLTPTAQVRYAASDIFNQNHSNPELYLRSGEKYLFKQNQIEPIPYSTTTESHSDWVPKTVSRPTLINHTSVKWNIICPSCKSLFKTKNEVKEEVKEYYKVNSLSEFVDRTRVSAPNLNKVFRDAMNKEKNCFALKNDVATNYGDMHHSYRELFPKSFWN